MKLGEADVYVGGGVESMTRAPFALAKRRPPVRGRAPELVDTTLGWRFTNPRMKELGHTDSLGQTAENLAVERFHVSSDNDDPEAVAAEYDVSREKQDAFALHSHAKAVAAQDAGRFADELVPVTVKGRKGDTVVDADEGPRRDSSMETLGEAAPGLHEGRHGHGGQLEPAQRRRRRAHDRLARLRGGARPDSRWRGSARSPSRACRPGSWASGRCPAVAKVLERAGVTMDDIGLIELNEAFAAQSLAVIHEWGHGRRGPAPEPERGRDRARPPARRVRRAPADDARARDGPPRRRRASGLATMCIGVGQGIAMVVEKV